MQKIEEEPFKIGLKSGLPLILKSLRFLLHYRSHPEALEPFIASLKETGAPEKNLSNVKVMLVAWRKIYLDRNKATYRIDRYLVGGIGATDLVLLSVVLPMGTPDPLLFIALLSLAVSLSLVSCSLLVSFVKDDLGITSYGKVHGNLIFLSLITGVAAMAAVFWHVSPPVGIVFLCLVVPLYLACASYFALARIVMGFLEMLKAASNPDNPETQQAASGSNSPGIQQAASNSDNPDSRGG